jgi:hercynylcysteine S-oxide lyase
LSQVGLAPESPETYIDIACANRWLFTPRGCALLHVPKRNQHLIRTTYPTSHGYVPAANAPSEIRNPLPPTDDKSPFITLFQFVATNDNAPYYCLPAALNFRQNLCPGGEEGIYTYIRDVAQRGADLLALLLGTEVMDELDEGRGLRTMGSLEGSVGSGREGWSGGLRDCAMANVLLPITIAGGRTVGSIAAGPGGAGSAGGLSPLHGGGRKGSYGFPHSGAGYSPLATSVPTGLEPPGAPWMQGEIVSDPQGSPGVDAVGAGPIVVQMADVPTHIAWMERTLVYEFNTFVAIYEYNGKLWTRICGQIYLELRDFEWLGGVLQTLCERVRQGESLRPENDRLSRPKTRGTPGSFGSSPNGLDLEGLGRSVSEVRLGPSVISPGGARRLNTISGSWVQV